MAKSKKNNKRLIYTWITTVILAVLFIATVWFLVKSAPYTQDEIILQHIKLLSETFKKVDTECGIVGFEDEGGSRKKCYIDFLNITSFSGSEAGALNVLYPDKWHGPYLKDNPTIQERFYYIMKIRGSFYIIPGDGIKLSNGKTIGKNLMIDENSDIESMMKDPKSLSFKNQPLAAKLELKLEQKVKPLTSTAEV
ncbi:MAG: hypothetical protein UU47_C0005G0025 [candidate division TM6 bacterium GW2011_GWE2_41_16]|nr:MAG: hypothetical protein UU47_C0005G0025 [candidate division TM6 bacterium GW2011_GWE2_41_16]